MSFHIYRVDKLTSEEDLLRKKLEIENQIRKQREKKRHSKSVEGEKYTRMLEPVTKSLEELKAIQKPKVIDPQVENLIDLDDYKVTPELFEEDDKSGEQFQRALNSIQPGKRDDGLLGLNMETKTIGRKQQLFR